MLLIRPKDISGAALAATNVVEAHAVYNGGTTYALGNRVLDAGGLRVYESLVGSNVGQPLSDPTKWLDVGPANKWAMFDTVNGTVTTDPDEIDVTMDVPGRVDSLALFSLANTVSVQVIVTAATSEFFVLSGDMSDGNDRLLLSGDMQSGTDTLSLDGSTGGLYNETFPTVSTEGIYDWYSYYFEEIVQLDTLYVPGLPIHADPTIQVIITGNGDVDAQCGTLIVGLSKNLGETGLGATLGMIDYSRKVVDDFGNYNLVERAFSKKGNFTMMLPRAAVDGVHKVLAEYRATPAAYIGSAVYSSTIIFGFFRDFNIEIAYPDQSLCSIEIEGLT